MRKILAAVGVLVFVALVCPVTGRAAEKKDEKKADKKAAVEQKAAPEKKVAKEPAKVAEKAMFRYGGDERIRQEFLDEIPIIADPPGVTRGGKNNYFRFRTRLWAEVDPMDNVTLKARVVNECRAWQDPDMSDRPDRSTWEWPDEWVFDNLYIDIRNLANDKLDLCIGRQDLIYGTGKVILEGTPKDGSRTIYFNAARATWRFSKDTSLDIFGIYMPPEDTLAINDVDRELTGYSSGYDKMTESGGGLYLKDNSSATLPFELYAIYKNESDYETGTGDAVVDHPTLDLNTFGTRLMPKFNDRLSGNLELAYQIGERGDQDVSGYMGDACVTYKLPFADSIKPAMDVGVYYLSGDDPDTAADEGWNPLWARYPQYSELYVYAYDAEGAARWNNLAMPRAVISAQLCKWMKGSAGIAYLYAPEKNGPGGGSDRGLLSSLKSEFTLKEGMLTKTDKLTGHLQVDWLEPGNYYNVNDTAIFARWQLNYEF